MTSATGKELTHLNFVQFKNNGRSYIRAYRNKWVPGNDHKKGQSRTGEQLHVGALRLDGLVVISKKFAEKFPKMANLRWRYDNNDLIQEPCSGDDDVPKKFKKKSLPETLSDDAYIPQSKHFLAVWALMGLAEKMDLVKTLEMFFSKEQSQQLLALAIYNLMDDNASADSFDIWTKTHFVHKHAQNIDGRRVTELYEQVTKDVFDRFWAERFAMIQEKRKNTDEKARVCALDSTSISTQSITIGHAAYGKAKRDPEYKQVNLLLIVDQQTRDIVYAMAYDGSINDPTTFEYVFEHMKGHGYDLKDLVFVTDRGYSTNGNANRCIQNESRFLSGYPIFKGGDVENFIQSKKGEIFHSHITWDPVHQLHRVTKIVPWRSHNGSTVNVFTHIYHNIDKGTQEWKNLQNKVYQGIYKLNAGKLLTPEEMDEIRGCIKKIPDPNTPANHKAKDIWVVIDAEMQRRKKLAGMFALRTNCVSDPSFALSLYRQRTRVETAFDSLKNGVNGERLRITSTSYYGKLLVLLLAVAMQTRVLQNNEKMLTKYPSCKTAIGFKSFNRLIRELDMVTCKFMPKTKRWALDIPPKRFLLRVEHLFETGAPLNSFDDSGY